ncbi:MAG: AMP-binding protein [Rhodospirillaceae bacterium]|nr:AMP-binding protein [Rhodospirillaceae bacterium]
MLDLGTTFIAAVEREPGAKAIVDGDLTLSYGEWLERILGLAAGLAAMGLKPGDRVATVLRNSWQMASLHWACQLTGLVVTPLNWRVSADELDYFIANADARAVLFEEVSAPAVNGAASSAQLPRIAVEGAPGGTEDFAALMNGAPAALESYASPEDISLMLYTSGTTGPGKGVPRRHRAERAAALAHVAQNCYRYGESTLGVMPLYHTMGVRSLLAMALVQGCFVCLPRFDAGDALEWIARERVSTLYLVPTLYHDLLASDAFAGADVSTVRKLGFAGAPMTDGLLQRVQAAFKPELFVNHYGSSEVYTFTIEQDAVSKPGSAGKAGLNQHIRVVGVGSDDPGAVVAAGEEGEIIASLASDEAFEGYWRRPEADEKSLKAGWYHTGDMGYFDQDGDLFVTGRVDDMIITGGENVLPVEIESVLSLHPGVAEIAVAGLEDERWGRRVTAFIKRRNDVSDTELDSFCQQSDLANFKRPREYVFVREIPKSPVGKILRRKLIAGEYDPE